MNRRGLLRGAVLALALRPFKDLAMVEVEAERLDARAFHPLRSFEFNCDAESPWECPRSGYYLLTVEGTTKGVFLGKGDMVFPPLKANPVKALRQAADSLEENAKR